MPCGSASEGQDTQQGASQKWCVDRRRLQPAIQERRARTPAARGSGGVDLRSVTAKLAILPKQSTRESERAQIYLARAAAFERPQYICIVLSI